MSYDVAFRFQQALDPSALSTLPACLHALIAAIKDCRNAGNPDETDPAVLLLARHLGAVAGAAGGDDAALRRACMDRIADMRSKSTLVVLAHRGVSYDEQAKKLFHSDGRKALKRLAEALRIEDGSYDLRSNKGGIAVSGEIILHGEEIYVQLGLGIGSGHEVMFRRVAGRKDYCGDRNHWAAVGELLVPERLAARIRRELHLVDPGTPLMRLVA
ncbi:hypothetical protein [Sphingopyxis sp.]|uniref:hypothetical protein n=1 Tax=Sphingopyxis sp. TaxID=1908224 RepID=UPI002D76D779|nr:hypothetical protein [Sphingopyxis sp.]HET6525045.1 hypothetical protein [Sphingopyxis sp.]